MIYIIEVAILRLCCRHYCVIYSYRNHYVNGSSSNISVCYRAIKDREAMVAIFKVFWSLLPVKALKLGPKVETGSTPLVVLYVCYGPSCPK